MNFCFLLLNVDNSGFLSYRAKIKIKEEIIYIHTHTHTHTHTYICIVLCLSLSHVQLFAAPWTVAHQAPLSMEFSRQEYWSGLPFPSPWNLPQSAHCLAQGKAINDIYSADSFRFLDANRIHLVKACLMLDMETMFL